MPFLGWLLIRMRSGWILTRNVARISVRNCTHISTTIGTASNVASNLCVGMDFCNTYAFTGRDAVK